MFMALQSDRYNSHRRLIDQMHRTRKQVFHDRLKWAVPVVGDIEIDEYDAMRPVYLIWSDETASQFVGCMRLMPTTGPTLLTDVFRKTFPENVSLCHPSIWEGTRTCLNDDALSRLHPDITPSRAFGMIMLAVCEWGLANYVGSIVTNYEPHLARVYRQAGVDIDEIGRSDGYGRSPVCCGLVEISVGLRDRMRGALQIDRPLLTNAYEVDVGARAA